MTMEEKLNNDLNEAFRGKEIRGAVYDELSCEVLLASSDEAEETFVDDDDDEETWDCDCDEDAGEYEAYGADEETGEYDEYGDDYGDDDDGEYVDYEETRLIEIMSIDITADENKLITDVFVGFRTIGGDAMPGEIEPEFFFTYEQCFDVASRFIRSILKRE